MHDEPTPDGSARLAAAILARAQMDQGTADARRRDETAAELLRVQVEDVRHTLARTDTTSATLLTLATALLAGLGGAAALARPHLTALPAAAAAAGTVALLGAVLCSLAAIRPRWGTGGPAWHAGRDPIKVVDTTITTPAANVVVGRAHDLVALSRICVRKHVLLRAAVDQLAAAVLAYTAAATLAAIGWPAAG